MTNIAPRLICLKIADEIAPDALLHRALPRPAARTARARIELPDDSLEAIFKRKANGRKAWLYPYGCVVLYGFHDSEERDFIAALLTMLPGLGTAPSMRYYESVQLEPEDQNNANLSALCEALARSVLLQWAGDKVTLLLDDADGLLSQMQKGRTQLRSRRLRRLISQSLRFEKQFSGYLVLPGKDTGRAERNAFEQLSARYELDERLMTAREKLQTLSGIIQAYNGIVMTRSEYRLLLFEIVLLVIFPLVSLMELLPRFNAGQVVQWLQSLFG